MLKICCKVCIEMKINVIVFEYLIMCYCLCRKKIVKDYKKWVVFDWKDILFYLKNFVDGNM